MHVGRVLGNVDAALPPSLRSLGEKRRAGGFLFERAHVWNPQRG